MSNTTESTTEGPVKVGCPNEGNWTLIKSKCYTVRKVGNVSHACKILITKMTIDT